MKDAGILSRFFLGGFTFFFKRKDSFDHNNRLEPVMNEIINSLFLRENMFQFTYFYNSNLLTFRFLSKSRLFTDDVLHLVNVIGTY